MDNNTEFVSLRKKYIEKYFGSLNPVQRDAALMTEGPVLVLAGAGSGKTTVVVNRIKNLIMFGDAYVSGKLPRDATNEDVELLKKSVYNVAPLDERIKPLMRTGGIRPWNICAITFTNKAAAELKSRICESVGEDGNDVFACTFHSACVRILRRYADLLGFPKSFTIYDADDSARVLKEIYKEIGVDEKMFPVKAIHSRIGRLKDEMVSPKDFAAQQGAYNERKIAEIYAAYQLRLRKAGAFDFDDLIYFTVVLLQQYEQTREFYHSRFRYIMVDEYQDTSYAQYRLVELLTGEHRNLCVVGDDDQSIYRFRGATIENILGFEQAFTGARVIRLEQNYRSTAVILDAANEVISHNRGRKGKTLWTDKGKGEPISVCCADSELEEAAFIAREIIKNQKEGIPLNHQAVLYRMNAQSNAVENYFARAGVPYRILGGLRFYDREEIKDVMAYLNIIDNPADNLRLRRIINKPARKIGDTTLEKIARIADGLGISMLEVVLGASQYEQLRSAANALAAFAQLYRRLREEYEKSQDLADFTDNLLDITGYRAMLIARGEEGKTKLENVEELRSSITSFMRENPEGDLSLFLEETSLVASIDSYDADADAVVMMTLHSAKGLEFDCVYMIGMEEGIFPSEMVRYSDEDIEEERRLAYVGITRARKRLYLTRTRMRMLFGQTRRNPESRFVGEFSDELKDDATPERNKTDYRYDKQLSRAQNEYGYVNSITNKKLDTPARREVSVGAAKPPVPKGSFAAGEVIEHRLFGRGVILSASPLGGDTLLEINFDKGGVKKAMANYAPIKKIEQ